MPPITISDAHAYSRGHLTIDALAEREHVTINTARQHITNQLHADKTRSRRRWTQEARDNLRRDMTAALEYRGGASSVIRSWGLNSIAHALGVLRIKSLDELRYGSNVNAILKPYKLKLVSGSTLRAIGGTGILKLGADEVYRLAMDPIAWLRENITIVRTIYPSSKKRGVVK